MNIKEIAKITGVSVATISRVFNEPEKVKAETRNKVLEVARKYSYAPHAVAKSLRKKRTGVYALTVMSGVERVFEDSYASKFLKGVVRYFSAHGLKLVVDVFTEGDVVEYYKSFVLSKLVDGFILMDLKDDDVRVELLNNMKVPFVCVGRNNNNNFIYVDTDNFSGGLQAGQHLFELGCKNVLLIGGDPSLPFERERYAGFIKAFQNAYSTVFKEFAYYNEDSVKNIVTKYLGKVDGIFCTSDVMAYAALRVCEKERFEIPIVGFDNILLSEIAELTTVDQNIEIVGEKTAYKLHMMTLGKRIKSEVVSTKLVVRGTDRFLKLRKGG
ncbi:MAG: LacI family DNA-binding transcriptional regulator [Fervidobacterium sp.]